MKSALFQRATSLLGNLFVQDLGIDLGTANTLVYARGRGIVINESSVVALNQKTGAVIAVGLEANRMLGKAPNHIAVVRPLMHGVVSDFEITEEMLRYFMGRVRRSAHSFSWRPRVVIGVSSGATEVERRAAMEAAKNAGAREIYLVEESVAGALGVRLPALEAEGILIVDIGGGTTEIAIISLGSIVFAQALRVAGNQMNKDIIDFARDHYQLLVGERTAEEIKIAIGSAKPLEDPVRCIMRGRNIVSGLPRQMSVGDEEIRRALAGSVGTIVTTVKIVIEKAPPELVADILNRGIYLVGGGSLLRGLDEVLFEETGVAVHRVDEPLTAVVRGTGIILEDLERFESVLKRE
ncbi:MAG: rod shape-determining protein [bacterium]|nr:rod shape-determining protein [bacterium]MDZ4295923.1 rod shape-determining protein [Patescibacteria group bacterium]